MTKQKYLRLLFLNENKERCKSCFSILSSENKLKIHWYKYHLKEDTKKCPYGNLFIGNCPIGCTFGTSDRNQMRTHLILMHSAK